MKTLFTASFALMMSLSSHFAIASNNAGGAPAMPIYRCVIDNDNGVKEERVPHHICLQKGGKTVF
ncbi:hypothetical protein BIT28_18480 [Photobacterium proteolyticum]|uniref:Uncharacterized protein n=1 Tax=Photobacterium proteolyticum TaxID=1903952 RepID=A0A1Q9GMW6_9GAMM|nr:hypothetical protein [Photobacterium proteolyticum]OLQ76007.1 hypothetical protein BIT28_18480 [Photobacterium proteolyticum]